MTGNLSAAELPDLPRAAKPRFVREVNNANVADAVTAFAALSPQTDAIQILRPFAVYSANAYSTPVTLPIGPAYLAGLLERAGYKVGILDAIGDGMMNVRLSPCGKFRFQGLEADEIVSRIWPSTRILGISLMFSQDWPHHRDMIRKIRAARPDLVIVVGGEHPTAMPKYVLSDCPQIDYLVTGEGELTFLALVHRLQSGETAIEMPGVCRIAADGKFVDGGLGRRITDFPKLPRPAWHLQNVENFFTGMFSMGVGYGRNMLILATRGCPYQCTFCSNPTMWTTRYLMRPPADVVDEIEHLREKFGCNSIDFADLTAIVKKEWILEFCAELKRRNLDLVWQLPSGTRSEALDADTVKAIYEAGCRYLVYAPESGSPRTLKEIKKKLSLDRLVESVISARSVGHTIKINLIIGFPNEHRSDMFRTLAFAVRMAWIGVDDCNIAVFTPYPGSEIYNDLRASGEIPEVSDEYFHNLVVQFDFTSSRAFCRNVPAPEIAFYRFVGMASFYLLTYALRPKRVLRLFNVLVRRTESPANLFEQRIFDYLGRKRMQGAS
ncbi:MAG: B12-binding domain-containing radical SAM protein [Proteobacteria bacterium]|nr:B12-binding domain-containing radical SAM protein [Pseudomonadota bacterium]